MDNANKPKFTLSKNLKTTNYYFLIFYFLNLGLIITPLVSYQVADNLTTLNMNGLALMFTGEFLMGLLFILLNSFGIATVLLVELNKFALISFNLIPFLNIIVIFMLTNLPNTKRAIGSWLIFFINLIIIIIKFYPLIKDLVNKISHSRKQKEH